MNMPLIGDYNAPVQEKKPTLLQWIRANKVTPGTKKTKFLVEIIFLPGKFDNYTLVTHAFRVIIPKTHALYAAFTEPNLLKDLDSEGALSITNVDKDGKFSLSNHPAKGKWEEASPTMFKFKQS
jgi:hypothetical protein